MFGIFSRVNDWFAARRKRYEDEVITRATLMGAVFRYEQNVDNFHKEGMPSLWMYYANIPTTDARPDGRMAVGETMYKCAASYIYFTTAGKWAL